MSTLRSLLSRHSQTDETFHEINVTPFVDVMLVLLVIFMITAPLLTSGVDVDLPRTRAGAIAESSEPLVITLDEGGQLFLQDTEVAAVALLPRLQAITASNTHRRVFVRAHRDLSYGRVMKLMGELQAAGYDKVALVTIFEENSTSQESKNQESKK